MMKTQIDFREKGNSTGLHSTTTKDMGRRALRRGQALMFTDYIDISKQWGERDP